MAPHRKRQRLPDDEDKNVAVESASFSFRGGQDTHRRKRVSVNQVSPKVRNNQRRDSTSSSSSSNDEGMPNQEADISNPPPATQYEMLRDGNFEDLQNPELDDERATQRQMARSKNEGRIGENRPAENAIIEEIRCLNFMCHVNMYVKLGPLINFLVGENGSGKSAILTALSLCLGGKAAATNRGGSLKSFIKSGEDVATLMVRLKNQGASAYQPDLFGESIIVERHFTKSGSSGFKLKSASGHIISNKKSDVEDMIEYFQLQVDNPMNILTQDAAKTFITQSNPKTKYQFFYKGTQLETLDNDYKTVYEMIDSAEAKRPMLVEKLATLKGNAEAAQEKVKIVEEHEGMRLESKRLCKQMAWAQVEEQETLLMERTQKVRAMEDTLAQAEHDVESRSEQFQNSNLAVENQEQRVGKLNDLLETAQDGLNAAKEKHGIASNAVKSHLIESRKINDTLKTARGNVEAYKRNIAEEQRRINDADGGAREQKQTAIEGAERRLEAVKEEFRKHRETEPGLNADLEEAGKKVQKAAEEVAAKRTEANNARKALANMQSNRRDPMAAFDPKMPHLLAKINHDRGFQQKPVGPIGMHIKLLQLQWSSILDKTFGGNLGGFIVTSKTDQTRLSEMIRQLNMSFCPIIIGRNQNLGNIASNEPDAQYTTILKVLEIDNELVRNQLIIHNRIEQVILMENYEEAQRVMFEGARPRNAPVCLSINDRIPGAGWRLSFMGQDRITDYIKGDPNKTLRMRTEQESQISFQKATVERHERELKSSEGVQRQKQQDQQRCRKALDRYRLVYAELKLKTQKFQDELDGLRAELDSSSIEDGRLDVLKTDLLDAEEEVALHEGTFEQAVLERDRLNRVSKEESDALATAKINLAECENKVKACQTKLHSLLDARRLALQEKNKAIEAVNEYRSEVTRLQGKRDKQAQVVERFAQGASEISMRVPVDEGMTPASIEAKLQKLRGSIKSYQARIGGDDAQIRQAAFDAQQALQQTRTTCANQELLLKALKTSLMLRLTQFKGFRRYISSTARIQFGYLLSERGFRGKMLFDHRLKVLDLTVEPDETKKSDKGRGTKTLSGGEKSFSSICLLLSVWEAMGAPLRCLDEFDVFMDDINREVSTMLIIKGARRSTSRQFILISPKSISGGATEGAPDVKIHKLIHPREQQRRIDEMLE